MLSKRKKIKMKEKVELKIEKKIIFF